MDTVRVVHHHRFENRIIDDIVIVILDLGLFIFSWRRKCSSICLDHVPVVEVAVVAVVDHDRDVVSTMHIFQNFLWRIFSSGGDRRRRSPGYAYDWIRRYHDIHSRLTDLIGVSAYSQEYSFFLSLPGNSLSLYSSTMISSCVLFFVSVFSASHLPSVLVFCRLLPTPPLSLFDDVLVFCSCLIRILTLIVWFFSSFYVCQERKKEIM